MNIHYAYAYYRFDSEEHNDGEKNKNKIGAGESDVEDVNSLLVAESTSGRTRVDCSNIHKPRHHIIRPSHEVLV